MDPVKGIELPPGTKISFYEVLPAVTGEHGEVVRTCIGYGGFGALYRVSRGSKVYALKLAHQSLSAYSAAERQWVEERGDREIATLKSLRHPNIVRVHAFDRWPDEDGRTFIVMDFVDGERLDTWRTNRSPSVRRICEVFIAIARALHAAHKQDIQHRDLKCSNVLVRLLDGQPVVVDWGISKPGSSYTITRVNSTVGTSTHFAPEYCRWALSPDNTSFETTPATELHAVGYMLYELLTGCGPFPFAANEVEMMRTIITMDRANGLRAPSELNPASPVELDSVVMRLLEKEPEKRFQSGEELAKALEELLITAPPAWDSPLDVPLTSAAVRPTRVDGPVASESIRLSKDHAPGGTFNPEKLSIRSLEPRQFASSDDSAAVPTTSPQIAPLLLDPVKAAAAKLRGTAAARRRVPVPAIVAIALLLVLAGIIAVAALGGRRRAQPENLLAKIERQERTSGNASPAQQSSPPGAEASLLPPAPPRRTAPSAELTKAADKKTAPSQAARTDQELPPTPKNATAPAPTKRTGLEKANTTAAAEDEAPAWLKPVESKPSGHRVATKFGVPTGAHVRARLLTNLDSRTVGAGPVEAKLMRPFVLDGRSIFPSGTVLIGNAASSGSRFTIHFVLLRLPDNREVPFDGLAYDIVEKKPGLAATRTIQTTPQKGDGVATKVARDAANTLLTAASGGDLGSTLATGAGRSIVNNPGQDVTASASEGNVLLLDAPVELEVFVTRAM